MSFNKENLVGIAQKSVSTNNYEESKASNISLNSHIDNQGIHVSYKDRKRWDEQSRYTRDYVDYRFKSIIGKFKFDTLAISNKLTLVEIIILLYNKLIQKHNKESVETNHIVKQFTDKIERMLAQDMMSRQLEIRASLDLIDELNDALDKEREDRKENDNLEIKARQDAINAVLNHINEQVSSLQESDQALDHKIEEEVHNRTLAIEEYEKQYTKAMNQYAVELQSILDRMDSLLTDAESRVAQLERRVEAIEKSDLSAN